MTVDRAFVLLHGASADPASWAPVSAALPAGCRVLTPQLPGLEPADRVPFSLGRAADAVTAAIDEAGRTRVVVCGVGLGALVALQLAVEHPDRLDRLVLLTRQTRLSPVLLSLPAAVLRLLPATAAQRVGVGQAQVLALLDQVRAVDFAPLARTVSTPAVVLCGARDPLNRHASAVLARTLPQGQLRLIPRAAQSWVETSPRLLSDALVDASGPG